MSRSSARRAQVQPFPALVAVVAFALALSAHAAVFDDVTAPLEESTVRDPAGPASPVLTHVLADLRPGVVVDPSHIRDAARGRFTDDYRLNVTIHTAERSWTAGPSLPDGATSRARRWLPVRIRPGLVRPGTVTVVVW